MQDLSGLLRDLSPHELDALMAGMKAGLSAQEPEAPIVGRPVEGEHPLSFAQRRIWFVEQLRPGNSAYHVPLVRRFRGPVDIASLARALTEIVRRHAVLRSVVEISNDGEPVQRVLAPFDVPLLIRDLTVEDYENRERQTIRILSDETQRPFDLSHGPLIRVCMIRLGPADHVLLLVMHHLVFDGWSTGVLAAEVASLYRAYRRQAVSPLPDLPIQYSDFARWQRERLGGRALESQLSYWKEQLRDAPAVLELPADRPRPPIQSMQGAAVPFSIRRPLASAVRSLGNSLGATPFMTLLAAFKVLLFRYTAQSDLLVGTLVAGRTRPETEALIGCFVNTLVLRTDLRGNPTFAALVRRVRDVATDAYSNQDVPFERVIDALQIERGLRHAPLVQVAFGVDNTRAEGRPGSSGDAVLQPQCTAVKFDIEVSIFDDGSQLEGTLLYNTDIFDQQTIDHLVAHYLNVLEAVTADSALTISRIPLLSAGEQEQILSRWSRGDVTSMETTTAAATLHELFERQVAQHPHQVAVASRDGVLTYQDLNRRANALAGRLRAAGVGAESLVALLMDRSPDVVVSVIAVLKAGAAYLPVEPDLPRDRMAFLLRDGGAAAVVTQRNYLALVREHAGEVACIAADEAAGDVVDPDVADANVASCARGDNAAYVFYTSGSTGTPKGVVITHHNVVRLFDSCQHWFRFGPDDVWALYHSYAFDLSVWEIWGALLYGGRIVVVPYTVSRDPAAMLELLRVDGVTVLTQTPTAFRQLNDVDERSTSDGLRLRLVVFAGEALDLASLNRWFERHGDRPAMINMYGITETTVHVTYREVTASDTAAGTGSYVGVPLADLQVYILDGAMQPVPVGIPGEIYVGGPGLARGYFNRPDLTADRFIPNPFSSEPGSRLYRSGDLARYRADGDVEYLGRLDHQVKIRGFRIELGEIESTLAQHGAVRRCAVLARREGTAESRLVAYVVPASGQHPTSGELRAHLAAKLPHYMIPAAFVVIDEFPLNANGKLDRKALPDPGSERPELGQEAVAPRTPLERDLAAAFASALGLEQVGIHDSFFALGGDSLRSVRVLVAAKDSGIHLSLEQLFEHHTVAALAAVLAGEPVEEPTPAPAPQPFDLLSPQDRAAVPDDVEDAYPVTAAQQGMLFHMWMNPGEPVYHNVDSVRFRVRVFAREAFQQAVDYTVVRHPVLRTTFDFSNYSEPLQLVHRRAHLPVSFTDLRGQPPNLQQEELRRCLEVQKTCPFDFDVAPLLRLHVHQLTDTDIAITQTELHAIHDGWSTNSMWVEIFNKYARLLAGDASGDEPPSPSMRHVVAMEREALASEDSRRYWEEALRDCITLDLHDPAATPGPPQIRTLAVPIDATTFAALVKLARDVEVPLKTVLLTAHVKALSAASGKDDILTGLVSHGRPESPDGDKIRGFFLNTVPFRQKLASATWVELIRQTFATELDLMPHQRYPLAAVQRHWGQRNFLDTAFTFIHFHVLDQLDGTGVEMRGVPYSINDNHFPLSITFNRNKAYWASSAPDVEMGVVFHYDRSKLTREYVETIAGCVQNALHAMIEAPRADHRSTSVLSDRERARLLAFSGSATATSAEQPALEAFEAAVRRDPDAPALADSDGRLSYRDLNARANRLARVLRRLGVGTEAVVAMQLPRSSHVAVAMAAVAKAGGAVLPLPTHANAAEVSAILRDVQPRVLIAAAAAAGDAVGYGGEVVDLERLIEQSETESPENIAAPVHSHRLTYVVGTSRSRHEILGVQVDQRCLDLAVASSRRAFALQPTDRVAWLGATPDAMVTEMWVALTAGACLCVPGESLRHHEASDVSQWLAEAGVTVSYLPTPTARAVLAESWRADSTLRVVYTREDDVAGVRTDEQPAAYRLYGAVESGGWSAAARAGRSDREAGALVGRVLDHVRAYVVGPSLQLVPAGVVGELCLGGPSLARGYIGHADRTAERFVPNPFDSESGGRLYRTGDLARFRVDGSLEYLGAIDEQITLRGFRVETMSIEAALMRHPAVDRVVVVAAAAAGGGQLLAFHTARAGMRATASELAAFASETLPKHLVPGRFVQLARLPLTGDGCVDRAALRGITPADEAEAGQHVARTALERRIAAIWMSVLHHDRIGIHDNFFDAGGDSLRLLQLHLELRREVDANVAMLDVLEFPTIAALAARLAEGQRGRSGGARPGASRQALVNRAKAMRATPPAAQGHPRAGA